MTLADLQLFIKGDPVMGAFFIVCAVVIGLGFLALPVALIWGVSKSGKTTMYGAAVYLLAQGAAAYGSFPGREGLYMALGFGLAGAVVFFIALRMGRGDPRRVQADADREENRRILFTFSGKLIAALTAGTCLYVAWMFYSHPGENDSVTMALGFFIVGLVGVFSLLFPAQATSFFQVVGEYLPERRRY